MDPAIGQMMPVLNSPLLSIHVSIIMMSYALLSLTFICGIMGICMRSHGEELQALSRVFLYPALTCMGFGIFIGAIWANVSWGNYWSWDSKETGHHLYDLRRSGSYTEPAPVPQAPRLPRLHDPCLPEHRHDIFRSKLLPHGHALVCLKRKFFTILPHNRMPKMR